MKKLKKMKAKAAKRHYTPRKPKAVRKAAASLHHDIAAAKAAIPAVEHKVNGSAPKKKRRGPTSIRFSADDLEMLNKLQARWKTEGPTTTLRKAMQLAESAVICTFIRE